MIDLLISQIEPIVHLNFSNALITILSSMNLYFLLILMIAFSFNRTAGLQLLLLVAFSVYLSNFLEHFYFLEQSSHSNFNLMPHIHSHLLVLSVFFLYLIPAVSKRLFTIVSLLFIFLNIVIHIYHFNHVPWDIVLTVVLALFIVFTFYRSLDWVGAIPEQLKLMLIFLIPLCLFLLSIENAYVVGLMFSIMFGMHLEQLKLGSMISNSLSKKAIAFLIGIIGYSLIQLIFFYINHVPSTLLIKGIIVGFWLAFFAPIILIKLHVYERFQPTIKS